MNINVLSCFLKLLCIGVGWACDPNSWWTGIGWMSLPSFKLMKVRVHSQISFASLPVSVLRKLIPICYPYWGHYYLYYLHDLPDSLNVDSYIYLYADDAKLSRHISTIQNSLSLQDDINKLTHWTDEWLTLKAATGGILPPSADFVEVRKLAKVIERQFFETLLKIIWGFENRWVYVNIYIRFIRTRPELQVKSQMVCHFH